MSYERLLAPLDGFAGHGRRVRARGGTGLNVTVPFKLEAFALARTAQRPRAKLAGAVNTLKRDGDGWYADNTDGRRHRARPHAQSGRRRCAGRDVLVLGAGGAARGIMSSLLRGAPALADDQQSHVRPRPTRIAALFAPHGPIAAVPPEALAGRALRRRHQCHERRTCRRGAAAVAAVDRRRPGAFAYDMIYGDAPTTFLRWARSAWRGADGGRPRHADRAGGGELLPLARRAARHGSGRSAAAPAGRG